MPDDTLRQRYAQALTKLYAPIGVAKLAHLDEAVDAVMAVRDEEADSLAEMVVEYERRAQAAERKLDAVRELHIQGDTGTGHVCMDCGRRYPCPTIRALDSEDDG